MTRDDFMENTVDVWEIPAESATRVGHPAPFPVELPARLIELYTYRGDLILDPFAGSGTTAVAAVRGGRHYVGYDLEHSYIRLADARVLTERQRLSTADSAPHQRVSLPAISLAVLADEGPASRAIREGRAAREIAVRSLDEAGFTDIQPGQRLDGGLEVSFTARDRAGRCWLFDVVGAFTTHPSVPKRNDAVWKAVGKAAVLWANHHAPLVLLMADGSPRRGSGAQALRQLTGDDQPIQAVVDFLQVSGRHRLRALSGRELQPPDPSR
jgi:DNA methylase